MFNGPRGKMYCPNCEIEVYNEMRKVAKKLKKKNMFKLEDTPVTETPEAGSEAP